jgi:hypothetical protein
MIQEWSERIDNSKLLIHCVLLTVFMDDGINDIRC